MLRPITRSLVEPARRTRSGLTLALGALALLAVTRVAPAAAGPEWTAAGDIVDVEVQVDGRTTPLFSAPRHLDRHYFQAFRGQNYSLVLRNNSADRIGVLIAVDGLNVVNGERSSLSRHEAMYVLDPWEWAEIKGWRTSLEEVRRFVFVDEEKSYAERSGKANGDMGWIRVLAFREEGGHWLSERDLRSLNERGKRRGYGDRLPMPGRDSGEAPPVPASPSGDEVQAEGKSEARGPSDLHADSDDSNPGTGWGDRSRDVVRRTRFTPESRPTDHIVLRYEYAQGLRALGIDVRRHRDRLLERENGELGFAQPPRR
jgi:hypothetical protein